jgi:hypothetical protein
MRRNLPVEARVWASIHIWPPDQCWPWIASQTDSGYGRLKVGKHYERAHRLVWELLNGPIPDGLVVRHNCDNKLCCNPEHLLLGTQADNIADRVERDRSVNHHSAEAITAVRERVAAGEKLVDVAADLGMSKGYASKLINGKARL